MALNKVLLIGNLGKDPEIKNLESGTTLASFSLATTERYKDKSGEQKEITEWHNIVVWRGLAEFVEKYVRKGSQVYIEGKLRTRSWEDQSGQKKYVTEIVADSIQMLGKKQDGGNSYSPPPPPEPLTSVSNSNSTNVSNDANEDDLPF